MKKDMRPFSSSLPNQVQSQGANGSAPQQAVLPTPNQIPFSSCAQQIPPGFNICNQVPPPPPHAMNNQFQTSSVGFCDNQQAFPRDTNGNNMAVPNGMPLIPPPCFPNGANIPLMQNGHLGLNLPQGHSCLHHHSQNLNQIAGLPLHGQFCGVLQNLNQTFLPQLQGQFDLIGRLQYMNQVAPPLAAGQFLLQNMHQNQFMGLPHGQFSSHNPMLPVNQIMPQQYLQHPFGSTQSGPFNGHPSFNPMGVGHCPGNTQMGLHNPNINPNSSLLATQRKNQDQYMSSESTPVQNPASECPVGVQNSQPPIIPGPTQMPRPQKNFYSSGYQQSQNNNIEDHGGDSNVTSENSKNFTRNPHGFQKRDPSHRRFQKPQFHHMTNARGNFRPPARNWGKGQKIGTDRKPLFEKSGKQTLKESPRPLSSNYTEQEIQQWREARKKNFPISANMKKNLAGNDTNQQVNDGDAKIRRQELKAILAKQAELGIEVAEIPPGYLSEREDRMCEGGDNRRAQNRNWKRFNKRGRHGGDKWRAKKPKVCNEPPVVPTPIKREPTLLQKLLSADIKRDKSQLLQVFRFMTLNAFFDNWPDKPLEFPIVTTKDAVYEDGGISGQSLQAAAVLDLGEGAMVDEIEAQKDSSVVDEAEEEGSESESCSGSDEGEKVDRKFIKKQDYVTPQAEKSEEGEITE